MATYTIFAGVNGAGKTSIYKTTYYEQDEERINTDEMVARIITWVVFTHVINTWVKKLIIYPYSLELYLNYIV